MPVTISTRFAFTLGSPSDVLLQFEAADIPEQRVLSVATFLPEGEHVARVPAQDSIGERIWLRTEGHHEVRYAAEVEVVRAIPSLEGLERLPPHMLPGEAVPYLFDSRYSPGGRFQPFVQAEFGELDGGQRVLAMRDWVARHFSYVPGSSDAHTTAIDTFVERRGVCRDYAHVMVSLARASGIPARYVSVYAPGVKPQDFHAVAEVFLAGPGHRGGGAWQIVDATGMADPAQTVKIGVGRDAADVSFMTVFGDAQFEAKEISVLHRV